MSILVVGAGIGGLCAARALTLAGHNVTVAERAPSATAIGAGLLIQPDAVDGLAALGVDVRAFGVPLRAIQITGTAGTALATAPEPRKGQRYGCTRIDLHAALLQAVVGRADVRWGAELTAIMERPGSVTCTIGGKVHDFDLVIGADGLRSTVRGLIGQDFGLRYSGVTCWRTILDAGFSPDASESWQGAERWGAIPVGPDRTYIFLVLSASAGTTGPRWPAACFRHDPRDPSTRPFAALDGLDQAKLLHHDLFELRRTVWGTERVLLLGDAAHAMTPNLAEGAAAAIADALALPDALSSNIAGAHRRYRARRRAPVALRRMGSRAVGTVAQMRSPTLRAIRDGAARIGKTASRVESAGRDG